MATIKDIAKVVGVSKSTVSRVVSGHGSCKPDTKAKILKAMREMNYTPNHHARAMVTKKTGIIGVIIYRKHMPIISHPYYGAILDAIATETRKAGYSIMIMTDDEATMDVGDQFIRHRVDGLILLSRVTEELINYYQQTSIPFVLINNTAIVKGTTYIVNDDYQGAYDAAIHLISKGYKTIAYISGPLEHRSYRLRWEGFQAALQDHGAAVKMGLTYIGDSGVETGITGAASILQTNDKPDAVFASNDMIAIGALQVFHSLGLQVPRDIAVMGFDDIYFSQYTTPALTTVAVDKKQMGTLAVQKLLTMLESQRTENESIILPPRVIARDST
ncbi:MAG: LacI family DNA-binding transcriptional regulator [Desulfosporosinus sp.]|nr:LacI family DNA-binding transcriptional regulator [Desulfosporosinus sp.]